jgi:hypothetical protein
MNVFTAKADEPIDWRLTRDNYIDIMPDSENSKSGE